MLPEKKRRREARIVAAASELFAGRGYGETSIEAIARQADVAVGTVYNYFQSKPALLMRVLTTGRAESVCSSAALVKAPPDDPVEAVHRLVMAQMRGAMRHDKRLWRVIHGTAALEPEAFGREYFLGKEQFKGFIVELLEALRDRGRIAQGADVEAAALTVKYVASEVFRRYVVDDYPTIEEAEADLRTMIEFIVGRVEAAG
ncbi:MAG: TetR/AcrR family transcriptional regulator [Alphaproteobacteria bacterium]